MKAAIIGAGISGLTLAQLLQSAGHEVFVIEKSKGVGGRMATRRSDGAIFDHGAQFYKPKKMFWHDRWLDQGLCKKWTENAEDQFWAALGGMTTLAKDLARDLEVHQEHHAERIQQDRGAFQIHCKNGKVFPAEQLFLSAPLPQSLELLTASAIEFDPALSQVKYAKALVGLFHVESSVGIQDYQQNLNSQIFSISNQTTKIAGSKPGFSVTMTPEWSECHFNEDDSLSLNEIQEFFLAEIGPAKIVSSQLKKWRYSHPFDLHSGSFAEVSKGLYLLGDAFGNGNFKSGSLGSAVASAKTLFDQLQSIS